MLQEVGGCLPAIPSEFHPPDFGGESSPLESSNRLRRTRNEVTFHIEIVAVVDLKTDRERQKLLMQQWTWISNRSRRLRKMRIEEALHRFEHFHLAR